MSRLSTAFHQINRTVRAEPPLTGLVILFLILATAYSVINPLHEGTDELRHYRFVRTIVENRSLPVQGVEPCRSQSHHPPLFYALGALLTAGVDTGRDVCASPESNPFWGYRAWEVGVDNKNMYLHRPEEGFPWWGEALAAHLVRLLNVLLGAGTVILTYLTGRIIWPEHRAMAAGGAALVAFNPMFLYMAGTINNDVIAALSGAAVIYAAVRLLHRPAAVDQPVFIGFWLGVVYAAALMSKFSLAPMALPLVMALFITAHRRRQVDQLFIAGTVMAATTAALAGWWFARNFALYGDPTGFNPVTELWGVRTPAESWGLVWLELPNVWSSFWGRFGFGQIPLPDGVYQGLWFLTLLAAGGGLLWASFRLADWWQTRRTPLIYHRQKPAAASLFILLLVVAISIAVVVGYMLVSPAGAMGRFLFPGLPAFALLVFWGLTRWPALLTDLSGRQVTGLALGTGAAFLALSVVALAGYLAPAYARPAGWPAGDLPAEAVVVDAVFAPFVRLHAYELGPSPVEADGRLDLTLYWEVLEQPPGDYYFFAHLFDEIDSLVAQRDTHPGTGKFPASEWRPGDRFVDRLQIPIPLTAYPAGARVQIGFYAPGEGYRLAVFDGAGHPVGDTLTLPEIEIAAREGPWPQSIDRNFEGRVRLLGYAYNRRLLADGENLELTLYWQPAAIQGRALLDGLETRVSVRPVAAVESTLTLSAPLSEAGVDPATGVLIQTFSMLVDGTWEPGVHAISLSLFDIFTMAPLNMIAERGNWIDNKIELAAVRVAAPRPR